jgi:hypothetical protein
MMSNATHQLQRNSLFVGAAFLAAVVLTLGSAKGEVPASIQQCLASTENPWIISGYCEAHNAWTRYYCQCAYEVDDGDDDDDDDDEDDDDARRPAAPRDPVEDNDFPDDDVRL